MLLVLQMVVLVPLMLVKVEHSLRAVPLVQVLLEKVLMVHLVKEALILVILLHMLVRLAVEGIMEAAPHRIKKLVAVVALVM